MRSGLALFERFERLGVSDAVLAGAAIGAGATAGVSADPVFADVEELTHVTSDATGVERLIAG